MEEVIKTVNLHKWFGSTHAVEDVNLSVRVGEIFGFLGLNGAGKTTTIRMLLGMVTPTQGQCYLFGKPVSPGATNLWAEVGYIVETPYSYPELTVRENLGIVRRLRGMGDSKCVDWIMEKLKLTEYAHRKARHLSLGNAQRLGIAKALIHRPKVLILDEPTNGLDPAGIVEVRKLLLELAEEGVTILISSHKLDEIARVATTIGIIHAGKLIKTIDGIRLKEQVKKWLVLDGRERQGMLSVLAQAGYQVDLGPGDGGRGPLLITDPRAVQSPDEVATLLVNAKVPPTLLQVVEENLEAFFLRTIEEAGGKVDE